MILRRHPTASHEIAALYVRRGGPYWDLDGVDPWDEERDARLYAGPWPVVAHPPCARWCRLAGLVEARWGHKRGEDGGCFEAALQAVRTWGGVLEHPAYTDAWAHHGLARPNRFGGWQRTLDGGWTCQVEQGRYGHPARKATWLYAFGIGDAPPLAWGVGYEATMTVSCSRNSRGREMPKSQRAVTPERFRDELLGIARSVPPALRWGYSHDHESGALVSWCGNRTKALDARPRVGKDVAAATPIEFRDTLLDIARSVAP